MHPSDKSEDFHPAFKCLRITAANGLHISYVGYIELEVEIMGLTIPEREFLIVKDSSSVLGLIGMNIIKKCQEMVHAECDTRLQGRLHSNRRGFQ